MHRRALAVGIALIAVCAVGCAYVWLFVIDAHLSCTEAGPVGEIGGYDIRVCSVRVLDPPRFEWQLLEVRDATGRLAWSHRIADIGDFGVQTDGMLVLVRERDVWTAHDATDGRVLWSPRVDTILGLLDLGDIAIVRHAYPERVAAIERTTGQRRWEIALGDVQEERIDSERWERTDRFGDTEVEIAGRFVDRETGERRDPPPERRGWCRSGGEVLWLDEVGGLHRRAADGPGRSVAVDRTWDALRCAGNDDALVVALEARRMLAPGDGRFTLARYEDDFVVLGLDPSDHVLWQVAIPSQSSGLCARDGAWRVDLHDVSWALDTATGAVISRSSGPSCETFPDLVAYER